MFKDLENKVVIVTGASRGIGRAIALELAKNKAKIVFSFLKNTALADSLISEIKDFGGDAVGLQVDVRRPESAKQIVEATKKNYGQVDCLVNNAGILRDKALMTMSDEDWKDVLETNLDSVFYLTRQVIASFLKKRNGSIVNISSVAGISGNAGQTNYSASKSGVIGFTKALAKEVAPYGVKVNAVAPGYIQTDMIKNIHETRIKEALKFVPMQRIGRSDEVAKVVTFLLSEASSYITGHVLPIDGGLAI